MVDWPFMLTPLLVLPIVLLFRFIGCDPFEAEETPAPQPRYRNYIMGDAKAATSVPNPGITPKQGNVIAYWRLVDAGSTANDEKGFQAGEYRDGAALPPIPPNLGAIPPQLGSEAAPGTFLTGQKSLIASDTVATCRFFNGGYVFVPYKQGLYTAEFTLEAWVEKQWGQGVTGFAHQLFYAGGFYRRPYDPAGSEAPYGFAVFANDDNRWQVRLLPTLIDLFKPAPKVPPAGSAHVALTVENADQFGAKKKVTLYVNAIVAGIAEVNSYPLPEGSPLFIGVLNDVADPTSTSTPAKPRHPILSKIQEVVLHDKALSQEEIENHVEFT